METKNSPKIIKPDLLLRARSKRVPTKRAFTFTRAWTNQESSPRPSHALVTEQIAGIDHTRSVEAPPSTETLSERPVPLITSSVELQIGNAERNDDADIEEAMEEEEGKEEGEEKDEEEQETSVAEDPMEVEEQHTLIDGDKIPVKSNQNQWSSPRSGEVEPTEHFSLNHQGRTGTDPEDSNGSAEEGAHGDLFDEHIEGGHFGRTRTTDISTASTLSQMANRDYLLQRHSTPIPERSIFSSSRRAGETPDVTLTKAQALRSRSAPPQEPEVTPTGRSSARPQSLRKSMGGSVQLAVKPAQQPRQERRVLDESGSMLIGHMRKQVSPRQKKPPAKKKTRPEPEVPEDMPSEVRIWQDNENTRSLKDISDLDVILERLEEVAWDIRDNLKEKREGMIVTRLMVKLQVDVRDMISKSHELSKLKSSLLKVTSKIRQKRKVLSRIEDENARLKAEIRTLKKRSRAQRLPSPGQDMSEFLHDLESLHERFVQQTDARLSPQKFVLYGDEGNGTSLNSTKSHHTSLT